MNLFSVIPYFLYPVIHTVYFSNFQLTDEPTLIHGYIYSNKMTVYQYKDVITFACNVGYTLKGSADSTCLADSTWTFIPPCKSIYFIKLFKRINYKIYYYIQKILQRSQ